MLIDSSHPEETRVVVLDGQKVEEFDFEAATKLPLKGNIYLAKVTRVEPSLQAAFVEYGGNRQGFLAFSEIHPDYYQIPIADRQALLAEQEEEARRQAEREDAEDDAAAEAKAGAPMRSSETHNAADSDGGEIAETENGEQPSEGEAAAEPVTAGSAETEGAHSEDDDYFPPPDKVAGEDEDVHAHIADDDDDDHQHHHHDEPLLHQVDAAEEIREGIVDEQGAANAAFVAPPASGEPDSESDSVHEGLGEDTEGEASGAVDPAEEVAEGIVDEQAAANAPMDVHAEQSEQPSQQQSSRPLQQRRPSQRWTRRRHYKIQEVIKRRQIILVQVVKEERGNKGAALTTYLSLAGRYCVLMPNTPRGGGISRKITSAADRKRLKGAVQGLELPEGMGLIIRTAGENRTKVEIKRDYEYLLRMWDTIRETTLASNAPACVYEEGDLIKRAIRDLYNKDVSEIIVEGDEGYKNAKDFMRMLMPSHAKNVKPYKEPVPLFQRHHIEAQLDAMFSPTVNLKSGGYIVINQTEALVSIDVNSGRATREHSIEETAHKTNLEAADEVARQLRLRDLAGLIVIDFIDMEDHLNDRNVEKRLYNAVKNDRARIQIGKISQFGLMEMSRQRLRAGVVAGSTVPCPHCGGQGIVRSVESTALRVLRGIEDEAQKLKASAVVVKVPTDVAVYTLNQKRRELARIESDYGMSVSFAPDDNVLAGNFEIERTQQRHPDDKPRIAVQVDAGLPQIAADEEDADIVEEEEEEEGLETEDGAEGVTAEAVVEQAQRQDGHDHGDSNGRRRRRRRGGRNRNRSGDRNDGNRDQQHSHNGQHQHASSNGDGANAPHDSPPGDEASPIAGLEGAPDAQTFEAPHHDDHNGQAHSEGESGEGGPRKRRRRRGRRGRGGSSNGSQQDHQGEGVPVDASVQDSDANDGDLNGGGYGGDDGIAPNTASSPVWSLTPEPVAEPVHAPEPVRAEELEQQADSAPIGEAVPGQATEPLPAEPTAAPRKGWWQRTFKREE
jgi:ribonuclease E